MLCLVQPSAPPLEETLVGLRVELPDNGTRAAGAVGRPSRTGATSRTGSTHHSTSATTEAIAQEDCQYQELPIISELLCFVANKISSMPYDMLVKLCTDFYSENDVECAKDILFNASTISGESSRKIKRRGSSKKLYDVQDILNIFLELPAHASPMFVCKNLNNIPPLSMNNFDMSSLIKTMESLQHQMYVLKESQDTSLKAQMEINDRLTSLHPPSI